MSETFPTSNPNQPMGRLAQAAASETGTPEAVRIPRLALAANVLGPAVLANETGNSGNAGNDHFERLHPHQEERMPGPYWRRAGR
jgi:hypothetical protein